MIEQSVIETLFWAIEDGRWERILGAVLVAIVAFVRPFTTDRFRVVIGEWISAVSALLGGVGAGLLAGTSWWHALIIGLVVLPSSRGFWDKVRSLLPRPSPPINKVAHPGDDDDTPPATPMPRIGGPLGMVFVLVLCASLSACGAPQSGGGGLRACDAEVAIVGALDAGLEATEGVIEGVELLGDLRSSVQIGRALTSSCVALRDRSGWQAWVGIALRIAQSVAGIIQRHRSKLELMEAPEPPSVPQELLDVITALEAECSPREEAEEYRPEYFEPVQ